MTNTTNTPAPTSVLIPAELAHRVADALGRFVSDEGWGQADMDLSDEFAAALAAPVVQEPVAHMTVINAGAVTYCVAPAASALPPDEYELYVAPVGAVPQQDRLLAALERAGAAESALRALVDECDNDSTPGWEARMQACILRANHVLAAIEADRQRRGEPVAWYLPSNDGYDSMFRDHATVKSCTGNPWAGWIPLYTAPVAPQPATPVVKESLTVAEPVKEVSAYEIQRLWLEVRHQDARTQTGHLLAFARALLARYGKPARPQPSGNAQEAEEAARYRWLRDRNDWHAEPRLDETDGTVWKLTFYTPAPIIDPTDDDSLDNALIAAMLADASGCRPQPTVKQPLPVQPSGNAGELPEALIPAEPDLEDAGRLDWLEARAHDSSYAIQLRLLRDPAINAGMNRIEVRTGVGSGMWERSIEGHSLREAIDHARRIEGDGE